MHVDGVVYSREMIDGIEAVIVKTDEGIISLVIPWEVVDTFAAGGVLENPNVFNSLETNRELGFFFMYQGFSRALDMPAGMLVCVFGASPPPLPTQMLYDAELRVQLMAYVSGLDFTSIVEMADNYLEYFATNDDDVAHEVRELAIRANEILGNMLIYVDDFDGQITIYYPGVREITQSINIVPYIRPSRATSTGANATLFMRTGFRRSNWLFFDRTSLRLSDGSFIQHNNSFFDRQTEILHGGIQEEVVRDWGLVNWDSGYIRRRVNYMDVDYDHVLRFTNRGDDTHHDVTLSSTEINAVRNIFELFQLMGRLGFEIPRRFR